MKIQLNTDKHLSIDETYGDQLKSMLQDGLSNYSALITRLEVHFSDENGAKPGTEDKKCLLEARLERKQPIVVTAKESTYDRALSEAIDKMNASLQTIAGKAASH